MSDFEMVSSSFSDHTCSQSSSNGIDPFSKSSEWTGSLVVTVPAGPSLRNDSSEREKLANQLLVVARCWILNTETLVRDLWQRPQTWTPYPLLPKCWPQSQPPAPPLYPLHLHCCVTCHSLMTSPRSWSRQTIKPCQSWGPVQGVRSRALNQAWEATTLALAWNRAWNVACNRVWILAR